MANERYEIIFFIKDDEAPHGFRRSDRYCDDKQEAVLIAKDARDNLGIFPVVVYDTLSQEWVKF